MIRIGRWVSVDPLGIVGLVLAGFAWWAITYFGFVSPVFLPGPGDVGRAIRDNFFSSPYLANYYLGDGGLAASLAYTTANVLIGLAISIALGVGLGLISARRRLVGAVLDPVVLAIGTIPILVTAPFFLIWFGTSRAAQVVLLCLFATTIIYVFSQRALANLDPIYESAARTLGAEQRKILIDIYLRGTLPEIFGGIRIAFAGAWGLEAVCELLGAPQGIGRVIQALTTASDIQTIMAAVAVLAVVAVVCDIVLVGLFGFITRWRTIKL